MKKILVLMPKGTSSGKPSFERVQAFIEFYKSQELHVVVKDQPCNFFEKIALIKFIYLNKISNVFISMPQFRNWWLFLLPAVNVILDIRDGWSIAMKSGYGGNVKPNRLKAFIASRIEKFAIKRAGLTITCTPGLQQYLERISGKEVVLIAPGVKIISANHSLSIDRKSVEDKPIKIGRDVWIGSNVVILPGVEIADGIVVGAGSVVTKSFVEPNIVIAGNPAKVIKKL